MLRASVAVILATGVSATLASPTTHYEPTWASLDSRPNPSWYDDVKFSVSLHWGVYSVPSFSGAGNGMSEWFWNYAGEHGDAKSSCGDFWQRVYGKDWTYADFAAQWKAELYDPTQWADLFQSNHVQLAVLTSKHHEGFDLFDSPNAFNWNSVDVGPGRDLVKDFLAAIRGAGLHAGVYHSVFEWFNPLLNGPNASQYVAEKFIPDMHLLTTDYLPDMFLMDGEWNYNSDFWQSKEFLAYLFNDSPIKDTVVVDDRWGSETRGAHGGVYVCENGGFSGFCGGNLTTHPWLYWATQGISWGFSRTETAATYRGPEFFVPLLVNTVANGGSLMLNFGPAADGTIPAMQQQLLDSIGRWLDANGVGIFNTTWRHRGQAEIAVSSTLTEVRQGQNNVDGIEPAANNSDTQYLGMTNDYSSCAARCFSTKGCNSFTWHDKTTGEYTNMCYGVFSSRWTLVAEAGHTSGRRFTQVTYTTSTIEKDTIYAFLQPYPSGETITLRSPVCMGTSSAHSAELLGVPSANVTIASCEEGSAGVKIELPALHPDVLSPGIVYGLKLVGFQ